MSGASSLRCDTPGAGAESALTASELIDAINSPTPSENSCGQAAIPDSNGLRAPWPPTLRSSAFWTRIRRSGLVRRKRHGNQSDRMEPLSFVI
jgi:hypothetical protein